MRKKFKHFSKDRNAGNEGQKSLRAHTKKQRAK